MIAASEPVEYVPRGRQAVDTHPEPLTCSRKGSPVQSDIHLANRLQNVVLSDNKSSAEAEYWMLREKEQTESKHSKNVNTNSSLLCDITAQIDCSYEEELYFSKNTAVWSKGLLSGSDLETEEYRNVICCYTCDTPIKHALFCTFYSTAFEKHTDVKYKNKKNTLNVPANKYEAQGKPIPSICLVDELNMRVFTESGEDYITSLEFQISNLFNTRFGIILQKEAVTAPIKLIDKIRKDLSRADASETPSMNIEPESANLPTLFSMNHPLDEACPLIIKYSNGSLNYANDASLKVVFSATDPSIVLVYDSKTGLHSIYRLRKALEEEYNAISNQFDTLSMFDLNSGLASVDVSQTNESLRRHGGLLHSRHSGSILGLGNLGSSPYSSRGSLNTPIMSPLFTPLNTPSPCRSLGSLHPFGNTSSLPRRQHSIYGFIDRSTPTGGTITPCDITRGTTCPEVPAPKPLYPDLCLEHLWTENLGVSTDGLWELASSCFLHCDLVGFTYLCYLQPTKEILVITRMQIHRDIPDQIIFGAATTIPAKDAISLPKMNMIALLDSAGCVTLYSGTNQVGKIHVGGMLTSLPSMAVPSTSSHSLLSNTFTSPFPRRSSLLPTSTVQPEKHFEDLHLLSPVAPLQEPKTNNSQNQNSNGLQGLRDGIGNRITLQYSSGQYYRIGIPPISNCYFIRKCLIVLKQILQRDIAMQVMIRWYGVRNAPGSQNISAEQEWNMFQNLLLELIGYDIDKLRLTNENSTNNNESVVKPKKKKTCLDPTNNDWEFLLKSKYHRDHGQETANLLNFKQRKFRKKVIDKKNLQNPCKINTNTILFQHLPIIFFSMHLLYEELKLETYFNSYLKLLVKLLFQLSYDLRLESYMRHYWKDFPEFCSLNNNYKQSQLDENDFKKLTQQQYLGEEVPNIFKYIFDVIKMETVSPYPYINQVNKTSKNLAQLANLFVYNPNDFQALENSILLVGAQCGRIDPTESLPKIIEISGCRTVEEKAVLFMINAGISRKTISHLPPALSMLCCWAIEACRENPPTTWTVEAYSLLLREDLVIQKEKYVPGVYRETSMTPLRGKVDANNILPNQADETIPTENDDGMENMDTQLFRLRFPDDLRITEVRRLLHSASPVKIDIKQSPEISGHELIEEQEKQLFTISTRTMALPYGRGMFTLRSTNACTTEPLPIPKLCLTGKATPKGTTVELTHIEVPPQMNLWPMFHNGVAAGLRISPDASDIDSTWIVYNKPQGTTAEMPTEHAGFLMALGLNGHLKNLAYVNIYDYLVKCHAMTSVGLLLGISATHRGTMDMQTTKLLSIHVEALLPPTSIELDIPQNIQVAALLGVGLVYEGTANRHIAEVLLSEIGRPPGPEMENSVEREAYSLAAGLGLGLVTLGQGGQMSGLTDLTIPDTLHYYMVGGTRRPLTGSQKEKYKMPSFQIREGDVVNIDVTAPGATLALGLMFFATGTQTVADWMKPPETNYLLDFVRPDLLLLRTISRGLILWNEIQPTEFWIEEQVPVAFRRYCLNSPNTESNIDYEGVNQAYCNILAGACFCIGLKYAGSANSTASQILSTYCRRFMRLVVKSIAELAGKSTVETCMNLILISLAMVMAGTGDLQTLRICRLLRGRVGVGGTTTANYGSHLATHAALGLLFLGAGRYSLSTAPSAVAAMVCAFFPKFPTHSNDNRYHLQAFRHLYVLAVEPRLLIPRDIDSGLLCYCHITVITTENVKIVSKAPCLLPELHTLQSVKIEDDRYWPIVFEIDRNWDQLLKLLEKCFCLNIKQRAGCLSYQEDPDPGFKTLLAHTLSSESTNVWRCRPENIYSFSNDPAILNYTQQFLMLNDKHQLASKDTQARSEMKLIQLLTMQTYECATKDMLHVLPYCITLFTALHQFHKAPTVYLVWQFKILYALVEVYNKLSVGCPNRKKNMLMTNETIVSILQRIQSVFDLWEDDILQQLKHYLTNLSNFDYSNVDNIRKVLNYITYYDIPSSINHNNIELYLSSQSNNLSSETILKLGKILN